MTDVRTTHPQPPPTATTNRIPSQPQTPNNNTKTTEPQQQPEIRTYTTSWRRPEGTLKSLEYEAADTVSEFCRRAMSQVKCLASIAFQLFRSGAISSGGISGAAKLREHTGIEENLAHSYFYSLGNACEVQMSLVEKLQKLRNLLQGDFEVCIPSIALFGQVPRYLSLTMAKMFNVEERWMNATIRGFRNKIDDKLSYRINRVNEQVEAHRKLFNGDERVLNKLQRTHALVFVGKTDTLVRGMDRLAHVSPPHSTFRVRKNDFVREARRLLKRVKNNIESMKRDGKDSQRTEVFLRKIKDLTDRVDEFEDLLEHILPSRRFLKSLAEIVKSRLGGRHNYLSALREIIAACLVTDEREFIRHLTVSNCISAPFSSTTRNELPLELHMGPKYVIARGNSTQITDDFRDMGYTEFTVRPSRRRKITMRVIASKTIKRHILQGARVRSVRVLPPEGPTKKVKFNITLEIPDFKPSSKFLTRIKIKKRSVEAVGVDPNRPSKDVFVIGSTERAPLGDISRVEQISKRIVRLRDVVLPRLARKRAKYERLNKKRMSYKLKKEIAMVHARVARLKAELDRACGRLLAEVVYECRPEVIGYEMSVSKLSTRGTRGALAKAITHMPKKLEVIMEYTLEVLDVKGVTVEIKGVAPRVGTHVNCGGRLINTDGWDTLRCDECGERVNRHHNAAMTYANRALSAYQGQSRLPLRGDKFGQ
jgi:hypothetical protein